MKGPSVIACCCLLALAGCRSARDYETQADRAAAFHIEAAQEKVLGRAEDFTIEQPSDTVRRRLMVDQLLPGLQRPATNPAAETLPDPLILSLDDTLRLGAAQSREYQAAKETVFRSALALDLEADAFRNTFAGALGVLLSGDDSADPSTRKITGQGSAGWTRKFKSGATLSSRLAFDLAKLLTADHDSSFGLTADASIAVPLLRGAGREIATEPLTQAERNMVYAIRRFELFKQQFAIGLADDYLSVLQQHQAVINASNNLDRVRDAFQRASQLSDSGRLPGIQVDQARQDVLRAESRLNIVNQTFEGGLDNLKVSLGIPADARVALVRDELARLVSGTAAPSNDVMPITEAVALPLALTNRYDLMIAADVVQDAERGARIARDALRTGLGLRGAASTRDSTDDLDAGAISGLSLRTDRTVYAVGLDLDLPWERTAERNAYRNSLIELESARRDLEEIEDRVKLDIRNGLRNLAATREAVRIQALAVELAQTRVGSTEIYLQAGRAEIRDVLEAQDDLVSAQDALTGAVVNRRMAELNLQQGLGVLQVNSEGLWQEYDYAASQAVLE